MVIWSGREVRREEGGGILQWFWKDTQKDIWGNAKGFEIAKRINRWLQPHLNISRHISSKKKGSWKTISLTQKVQS